MNVDRHPMYERIVCGLITFAMTAGGSYYICVEILQRQPL